MADRFAGWKGDFQGFFLGLQADNSKSYFEAHRAQYENEVKGPMVALLSDLEAEFGPAKLSRPNRDIRFSADKSPYKTNIYASAAKGGYVALQATGLVAAGGRYMMDAPELARYRAAVAKDAPGVDLAGIVGKLKAKNYDLGEPELKRVPAPYDQDHPRADLLRCKRLIYWRTFPVEPWIATPKALDKVREVWRDGAALNAWFEATLG